MFLDPQSIMTCSQFTGKYSDLQVSRVTVNTGTGHAVRGAQPSRGGAVTQGNAVGDGSRESFAAKTRCQAEPRKNDGFLKKVHKG